MKEDAVPPISEYGPYELIFVIFTQYFPVAVGVAAFFVVMLVPIFYHEWKKRQKKE
ncbi:MAG: hypothetical protein ACNS63_08700 [Candidatus Nitrospinota bacterium M3_3B_026]